jgi:hypothetical protein
MTDRRVRKYRAAKKSLGVDMYSLRRRLQDIQRVKIRKRQKRTVRNVKKDRVDRTELHFHNSLS